jgi:hypothetical protein
MPDMYYSLLHLSLADGELGWANQPSRWEANNYSGVCERKCKAWDLKHIKRVHSRLELAERTSELQGKPRISSGSASSFNLHLQDGRAVGDCQT